MEQIVAVQKVAEVGVPGTSEQTLYRWKKKYTELETDQVRQFNQPEENGLKGLGPS